jgi:hypothetical protein
MVVLPPASIREGIHRDPGYNVIGFTGGFGFAKPFICRAGQRRSVVTNSNVWQDVKILIILVFAAFSLAKSLPRLDPNRIVLTCLPPGLNVQTPIAGETPPLPGKAIRQAFGLRNYLTARFTTDPRRAGSPCAR